MEIIKQRYSHQREAILQIVKHTTTHPNADWIYNETRKSIPNVSLGTVYRNLSQLVEAGKIQELKDKSMVRYDGNTMDHDHFLCDDCGKWYDIDLLTPATINSFSKQRNFKVKSINLEIQGTCESCLNK